MNVKMVGVFSVMWVACVCLMVPGSEARDIRMRDIVYHDEGKQDPFLPLIGKNVELKKVDFVKTVNDLHIEGILVDNDQGNVVIVSGHVLRTGNYIGGFRIDEIRPREVVFSRDNQKFTVTYGVSPDEAAEDEDAMFRNFDETV